MLRGVYVSVNGQLGACDALRELGLQGKGAPDLPRFDSGKCGQCPPRTHRLPDRSGCRPAGARPIELLMDYLLAGEKPETDRILACIDIRNRYNV